MSSAPKAAESDQRKPVTVPSLLARKQRGEPIVMVTAYDYPSARAAERAAVDIVLVGDSAATTVLGYDGTTTQITMAEMVMLAKAVRRGLRTPLLVGDLPFGSYEVSDEQAVATAIRYVREAGCDVVKLEGGGAMSVARAKAIVDAGIPVMGHVGLTPQTATALGGWRAQGRSADAALEIARGAKALQDAGCFSIVFEAVPSPVTEAIVTTLTIPVIGIGAGPSADGQVLVFHDLLGIRDGVGAKFVKRYADLQDAMDAGVTEYADDVRNRRYPAAEHGYAADPEMVAELQRRLAEQPA
ncbi:MAG: 3-methyl-2-oxobutanoate hydroxymethyltransferase [Streptosporangiales bacterium]|nr:3-methyl-2-oxobutanoate hydroxymethyltransferase [Streptosporangiales bacterium]